VSTSHRRKYRFYLTAQSTRSRNLCFHKFSDLNNFPFIFIVYLGLLRLGVQFYSRMGSASFRSVLFCLHDTVRNCERTTLRLSETLGIRLDYPKLAICRLSVMRVESTWMVAARVIIVPCREVVQLLSTVGLSKSPIRSLLLR
jgi:hypothetical protein